MLPGEVGRPPVQLPARGETFELDEVARGLGIDARYRTFALVMLLLLRCHGPAMYNCGNVSEAVRTSKFDER